jgi:hypothetical protein
MPPPSTAIRVPRRDPRFFAASFPDNSRDWADSRRRFAKSSGKDICEIEWKDTSKTTHHRRVSIFSKTLP